MKDAISSAAWWQRGIVYQIYPWSFMDANDDGIGDLEGIRNKLDYLEWLGVDALWLSPIYPSPMCDFGYDVSDYCNVDPRFGTLGDFDALLADAHRKGLRVILDYVANHTSDQHPWFLESKSSRHNPKRDWYLWCDAKAGGGPPNNWLSEFGGGAWQWDAHTEQYYYHAYLKEQPDLNWRNPELRQAMLAVLRFWLDRGVDGFRIDAVHHLIKDDELRDNPANPAFTSGMSPHRSLIRTFTSDRPELQPVLQDMRRVVDGYDERVLIGEAWLPFERLVTYYGPDLSGLHLPFNFHLIHAPWEAAILRLLAEEYERLLPLLAWPNWVLGNHDRPRIASRVGDAQARVAAMLLLSLRGTPTLYYGDELGMRDVSLPAEQVKDPFEKNVPGLGLGRDPARTPMQWNTAPNAGFTRGVPWLPVAADFPLRNALTERQDPDSLLSLYRRLIALRRREAALSTGTYEALDVGVNVLGYLRRHAERALLVALNLTNQPQPLTPDALGHGRILLSTHAEHEAGSAAALTTLLPNEGVIAEFCISR